MRLYLDDPARVRRLFLPPSPTAPTTSKPTDKPADNANTDSPTAEDSPTNVVNLLMGVRVLQQAIVDLLLDIMVECCGDGMGRLGAAPAIIVDEVDGVAEVKARGAKASTSPSPARYAFPVQRI